MIYKKKIYESLVSKKELFREFKWQILEKFLRSFTIILINFIVTSVFGPEVYGKYSYAISLTTIFIGVSNIGMPNLIVSQVSKYRKNREKIISCFLKIRIFTNLLIFLVFIIYSFFNLKLCLLLSLCVGTSFLDIFESYNQGKLNIIRNTKAKIIAYTIGVLFKLIAIFYFNNYKLALLIYSFEFFISYFLIYQYSSLDLKELIFYKVDIKIYKNTIKRLIPLCLTTFFTILAAKLDVLIIQSKFGYSVLGKYNIFSQVIILWSIIPIMLSNYHMPRLAKSYSVSVIKYKKELIRCGKLYMKIGLFTSFISIIVFNLQYQILGYTNNDIYIAGIILCFVNIPLTISLLQASIIAINNLQLYCLIKTITNFIIMLICSIFLIKYIGIIGLPISINLSYLCSEYILPMFFKNNIRFSLYI